MAGYKAFISYNHAVDGRLAPMLQSGVRRIGKPWYRLPFRVFRDKTSLNPPILWKAIERALESSEYFLLLACPESAGSSWVDEEIRWWLKNRPLDRLIIVLTGGEIVWDRAAGDFDWTRTSALGVCLRGRFNQEPLHVDLRWARTEQRSSLTQSRFRQAILDIGSTLRGTPRDTLDDEDVRHSRLARRLAGTAIIGLTALSVATGIAAYVAQGARRAEQGQRERAETAATDARRQRDTAEQRRLEADEARRAETEQRQRAEEAAAEATRQREVAITQRDLALCRQLAANSLGQLDQRLDLAMLIAVEAHQLYTCPDLSSALLAALHHQPFLTGFLSLPLKEDLRDLLNVNVVTDVAFSPDGTMLAASSWSHAQLWNVETMRPIGTSIEANYGLTFTADGKTLVASDGEESVRFWDTATGAPKGVPLEGHESIVLSVELSPDGSLLASGILPTGRSRGGVYLWDMATRHPAGTPLPGRRHAFSPDGTTLGTDDETFKGVVLWDVEKRMPRFPPLEGHTDSIGTIAFSPDGALLASGASDNLIIIWDVATRSSRRLTGHTGPVNDVAFSHDGRLLASAGGEGQIILWDTTTFQPVRVPLAVSGPVFSVAFSPDDATLASTGGDERVFLWNVKTVLRLGEAVPIPNVTGSSVAFSRDGRSVAFVAEQRVQLWDLRTGASRARFGDVVQAVDISPDGNFLAAVSRNGGLSVWDVSSEQPFGSRFELGNTAFWSVRFSPDGNSIAIGGDSILLLWDRRARRLIGPPRRDQRDRIWSFAFSPDGKLLAAAGSQSLRLWRLDDEWRFDEIVAPSPGLTQTDIAFSPDGRLLAFRSGGQSVTLWDVARKRPAMVPLTREKGSVSALAFSPDGEMLAVGGGDGAIMLWDVRSGEQLGRPLFGHGENDVDALTFGPNGRTLVSVGAERMVIWDFRPEAWVRAGCRVANRALTPAERARYFGGRTFRSACTF